MFNWNLEDIATLVDGQLSGDVNPNIAHLETDTRLPFRKDALFVSLEGDHYRGDQFIEEAEDRDAIAALVPMDSKAQTQLPLIRVENTLEAFLQLAGARRRQLDYPILAVTGSNGKTMFKDFLATLLTPHRHLGKSPGSFNSFVGIARSLLELDDDLQMAIIETGVSSKGEMARKEAVIRPNYGVLTNIGLAHFEGFGSRKTIAEEKIKLFAKIPAEGWALLPEDPLVREAAKDLQCQVHYFGENPELPRITRTHNLGRGRSTLDVHFPDGRSYGLTIPVDFAFQEVFPTFLAGICAAWLLGVTPDQIADAATGFNPPLNRIEVWKSQLGSILVNDAYSADPISTRSCLHVFKDYHDKRKVFIFGGMRELGERTTYEHRIVAEELAHLEVDVLLTVGELAEGVGAVYNKHFPNGEIHHFKDVASLADFTEDFTHEGDVIVIKGPRDLNLETLSVRFKARLTQSVYYIDLSKIRDNLITWREHLPTGTKLLAMVKALAYGADAVQIASFLQQHIHMFGVAYTKEAVSLRRNGISAEILVQLVLPGDAGDVVALGLQAVILEEESARLLSQAAQAAGRTVKVHLEVDTGMGRFGVFPEHMTELAQKVQALPNLEIVGLMTHFSSADDPHSDPFTRLQLKRFEEARERLKEISIDPPLIHAAATAAAARFPEAAFSMVRIGLGIHGIYPSPAVAEAIHLKNPLALVSRIGNIKSHPEGSPISYNRRYITKRDSRIAYLPIGYHDGLSRRWGRGGYVMIKGKRAPIVGAVCMDFTPVDITEIPEAEVGDEALIFGEFHGDLIPVEEVAALEETIPYEVLCRLSDRIQRIYLLDEV